MTAPRSCSRAQAIDVVYFELITAPTYVGQTELHEYLALFRSRGYELFDFYNPVRKNGRLLQTDNIMVSGQFLARYEREGARTSLKLCRFAAQIQRRFFNDL